MNEKRLQEIEETSGHPNSREGSTVRELVAEVRKLRAEVARKDRLWALLTTEEKARIADRLEST